jgi:hypothetical protein
MRQVVHMFYAMAFMLSGSSGKPIEPNVNVPEFRDFHNRIWAGGISLVSAEAKLQYARVHMNQTLHNMRAARFKGALQIVSARHPSPLLRASEIPQCALHQPKSPPRAT